MREDSEIDLPPALVESLEDMTSDLLEIKGLVLALALGAHKLTDATTGTTPDKSH